MPDNGFGWHTAERPPTSDEFVAAQRRYYRHTIECFGAERCMFESNFPVDRMSLSYRVLWNGLKKIAASCSRRRARRAVRGHRDACLPVGRERARMTTHERELTEPVDLCTPDGAALNPAARGWSRRPLHRANLDGQLGGNKRWDYWAVLAGDLVVSSVYSDIDHFGLADVWWADLGTGGDRAATAIARARR